MASTIVSPVRPSKTLVRRPRVLHDREAQSVLQIKDRVWRAKIRKVERIEDEEDYMWGLIADKVMNDPADELVPLEVVRRELGLDRPEGQCTSSRSGARRRSNWTDSLGRSKPRST